MKIIISNTYLHSTLWYIADFGEDIDTAAYRKCQLSLCGGRTFLTNLQRLPAKYATHSFQGIWKKSYCPFEHELDPMH